MDDHALKLLSTLKIQNVHVLGYKSRDSDARLRERETLASEEEDFCAQAEANSLLCTDDMLRYELYSGFYRRYLEVRAIMALTFNYFDLILMSHVYVIIPRSRMGYSFHFVCMSVH